MEDAANIPGRQLSQTNIHHNHEVLNLLPGEMKRNLRVEQRRREEEEASQQGGRLQSSLVTRDNGQRSL